MPVVVSQINESLYAVVNLATADELDLESYDIKSVTFADESPDARTERRGKTWIPYVEIF